MATYLETCCNPKLVSYIWILFFPTYPYSRSFIQNLIFLYKVQWDTTICHILHSIFSSLIFILTILERFLVIKESNSVTNRRRIKLIAVTMGKSRHLKHPEITGLYNNLQCSEGKQREELFVQRITDENKRLHLNIALMYMNKSTTTPEHITILQSRLN